MTSHRVTFLPQDVSVEVPTGALIAEAAREAGLTVHQPCGGQGRCGRCAVLLKQGEARRRSTLRLSVDDLEAGLALACQTVVEGDLVVAIPEQAEIQRRLVTEHTARKIELPFPYDPFLHQNLRTLQVPLHEPTIQDSLDDLSRLRRGLAAQGYPQVDIPLPALRRLGEALRQADWRPWVALEIPTEAGRSPRLSRLAPEPIRPAGLAVDIGTTTVTAYLVDLISGEVTGTTAEYNGQISYGEDVISRIIYSSKNHGLEELSGQVRKTLSILLDRLHKRTGVSPDEILKVTVAGNTTMIHLFLGLPPAPIRVAPYIPTANQIPVYSAGELGLPLNPSASVECLHGVASYVGADITAGVLASGLADTEALTLFIDVGTNGEMVLGTRDWMVTCACSAGPAFEGAGVVDGMRATEGAIEEVWVSSETLEPTYRVIGDVAPRGICGSGLISLLAELFVTGVIDRGGNIKLDLGTPRVRQGEHGPEYVVAWAAQTAEGRDLVLTKVDVDNLLRAKAAIYAGFTILASSVGVNLADVQQLLIGGSFGKYINVEKAIQIGLLPDLPWDRFHFLGNTSVLGAYMALLSRDAQRRIADIARMMTYIELSADNSFYDAFTAALFLPHTEISRFPSVAEVWEREGRRQAAQAGETR
jgi:uncharacterized 2Fe-2S/4Fe-4S cluster protein (DUF4445 family)